MTSAEAAGNAAVLREYGIAITYQRAGATPFSLPVICGVATNLGAELPGRYLGLWFQASDFPNAPTDWNQLKGDQAMVKGSNYTVVDASAEEEGGGVTLAVSKVAA